LKGGDFVNWVETLNNALDYIEDNLIENISCSDIAKHVYMSNSHFQRGFYYLTGMTIGEYIRNRRLTQAGHELTIENAKLIDIAMKYGYESSDSFSKAFSRFHGISPSQVKHNGVILKSFNRLTVKIIMEGGSIMDYRIEKKDAFSVIIKAKFIDESDVAGDNNSVEIPAFWGEYFNNGFADIVTPDIGMCGKVDSEKKGFYYGIGTFSENVVEKPDGFEKWDITANTWAVFKCIGAMPDSIQEMWKRIFSEWLPQAKYEMIPSYDFELYTDGDTDSPDYVSEIWIPVKKK
jgi:AraC family transcriptional regulator